MDLEIAGISGSVEQVESDEFGLQMLGTGGGGVDEADVGREEALELGNEQRVVGAGEQQRIDAFFHHRIEVGVEDGVGGGMV